MRDNAKRRNSRDRFLADYKAGFTDSDIARRDGCDQTNVSKWRWLRGLPPNFEKKAPRGGPCADKLRAALAKGITDNKRLQKIANCHEAYVRAFRNRESKRVGA